MNEETKLVAVIIGSILVAILMNFIFIKVIDERTEQSAKAYEECVKAEYGQTVEQIRINNNGQMPSCQTLK